MTGERRAVWASAALALALLGCGSITALDDAGPTAMTDDADASPPDPGTGRLAGTSGDGGNNQRCVIKDDCKGLVCNVSTGSCVACLVNADCKGKTKLCDPTTLTCLACSSDEDCDGDKGCVSGDCQ
jgi:hypothetical protein